MKDIFVVDSYAKSAEQVGLLASMIEHLTEAKREICLVSHLPIPERLLTPNVKFVLFDANNILGPMAMTVYLQFLDMEVRYEPTEIYHGAAVYANLHNALRLLAHEYEWVHFIESDLEFENVEKHIEGAFAQFKERGELSVIGYPLHPDDPAADPANILTNLFSLRPEIGELLPRVFCWEDYKRLCGGELLILEKWLVNRFKAENIQYALVKGVRMANKYHPDGDYMVIKCRQYSELFTVFVHNPSRREIEVTWPNGTSRRLRAGQLVFLPNLGASDEVHITYVGEERGFRHRVEAMQMGAFRKPGFDFCPDWRS
jgi:hypothetical protein